MAGLAASRIFAAGGAGDPGADRLGLRRAGMAKRLVADKTLSFLILTYFPYVAALIVYGLGHLDGLFPGGSRSASPSCRPSSRSSRSPSGCRSHWCRPISSAGSAAGPTAAAGRRRSRSSSPICRRRPRPACATRSSTCARATRGWSAFLFWGFQILVLWAAFRAFGDSPPAAVLVQAFFVGMLEEPAADARGRRRRRAVAPRSWRSAWTAAWPSWLCSRAFTFWLPLVPGVIAYLQLRKTVERWTLSYTK